MKKSKGSVVEFKRYSRKLSVSDASIEDEMKCEVFIGANENDKKKPFVSIGDDARSQHLMMVGASGTGKSTCMVNTIDQLVRKKSNESIFVLNPHGGLYKRCCQLYFRRAMDNFVFIDLANQDHGFQLNPLSFDADKKWFMVSRIVNDFLELFEYPFDMRIAGGPMFELYMRHALLLLLNDEDDHSIGDVAKLFNNREFRKTLLSRCERKDAQEFWINALKMQGDHSLENFSAYVSSKLVGFTTNPILETIFNNPGSSFDFSVLFKKPTVVFVNLHKGILSTRDIKLLGTMFLQKINLMALQSHQSGHDSVRCNVILDEAHNFLTPSMVQMFPEARKFGINMLVALQNLQQLETHVDTLLGNTGNIISFRVGNNDAYTLCDYFNSEGGYSALCNLPNFNALTRLLTDTGIDSTKRISVKPL